MIEIPTFTIVLAALVAGLGALVLFKYVFEK